MRFVSIILILCFAFVAAVSQDDPPKYAYLEMPEMKQMVVVRDFRDVPSEVRDMHAEGYLLAKVKVDVTGQAVRVSAFSLKPVASRITSIDACRTGEKGKYDSLPKYIRKAVSNWTFKPLLIDGQPVAYEGYVLIGFWYGSFLEEAPKANTSESSDQPR